MAAAGPGGTCDVALQLSGSGAQQRDGAAGLLDRAHAMSRVGEAVQSGGSRRPGAGDPPLSDPPAPRLGWRRQAVLQSLRHSPEALAVADIAALTELHPNTARFHLDALAADGLAVRTFETRTSPGRPRVLYEARAEALDQRSYGLLAEMLAGLAAARASYLREERIAALIQRLG